MLNRILWPHLSKNFLKNISLFFTLICFMCLSSSLLAISTPTIVKDDNQPIDITSDNASFDEKTGDTIYQGHVRAIQGTRQLWSDSLIIHRTKEGKINHIVAKGAPAHFVSSTNSASMGSSSTSASTSSTSTSTATSTSKTNHTKETKADIDTEIRGKANFIHYYPNEQKIIFLQNAELAQNDRLIQGAHLIYFIKNRTLISESAVDSKTVVIIKSKSSTDLKVKDGQTGTAIKEAR